MHMQANDFELPDQNGNIVSLRQFRGTKVVLYFFPKADTPGCTVQACGIRDNIKLLQHAGVVVLGVSPDSQADLKRFEQKHNLNFTLLSDPSHETLESYGVWKEKSFMGRHFMGVERTTYLINEQGAITKTYERVNPVTHADSILSDLGVQGQQPRTAVRVAPLAAKTVAAKKTRVKAPAKKAAKKKVAAKKTAKKARKKSAQKR